MTAVLSVQGGVQESNSPVQAKPGGCKMMPRVLRSPKIKGLDQSGPDVLQAPPEPLPAEDSMSQFALLLWFSVVLGYFVSEFCSEQLTVFSPLLGAVLGSMFLSCLFLHKGCLCFPQLSLVASLLQSSISRFGVFL